MGKWLRPNVRALLYYVDRQTMKRTPKLSAASCNGLLISLSNGSADHGIKEDRARGREADHQKSEFL
jgi:hypothetical protein